MNKYTPEYNVSQPLFIATEFIDKKKSLTKKNSALFIPAIILIHQWTKTPTYPHWQPFVTLKKYDYSVFMPIHFPLFYKDASQKSKNVSLEPQINFDSHHIQRGKDMESIFHKSKRRPPKLAAINFPDLTIA